MKITIFYSWQSDISENRWFIEDCIKRAIKKMEGVEEIIVDRDTKGRSGSVSIINTILEKIRASQIVIADLTIINADYKGRKMPNPNVLFETGYAAGFLGEEMIISLFNEKYGIPNEDFPFDIKTNRLTRFRKGSKEDKDELIKALRIAISSVIKTLKERDRLRKIKSADQYQSEQQRIKEFIKLFRRRAFSAPFHQEHPVEMFESINGMRISIQVRGLILDISDFEVQQKAEKIYETLDRIVTEVQEKFPVIPKIANEIDIPAGEEIRERGILSTEKYNEAVNFMIKFRSEILKDLEEIENYYKELSERGL